MVNLEEVARSLSTFGPEGLRRLGILSLLQGGEDPLLFLAAPWALGREAWRPFPDPAGAARFLRERGVDSRSSCGRRGKEALEAQARLQALLLLEGKGTPWSLSVRLGRLPPCLLPALALLASRLEEASSRAGAAEAVWRMLPLLERPGPGALKALSAPPPNPFTLF